MGKRTQRAFQSLTLFFIFTSIATVLYAQTPENQELPPLAEQIQVHATKDDLPLTSLGQNAIVITAAEIQRRQWSNLAELMRVLPGVSLTSNGGEGTVTTAFVRGAKSENTLVLLDGVKLNDPSTPGRVVDFAHLSTLGVVRIEYLSGPQSALYGSDASSGVINIITNGSLQKRTSAQLQAGTGASSRVSALVTRQFGNFNLDLQAENHRSKRQSVGFDPHSSLRPTEKDGYKNTTARLGFSWQSEKLRANLRGNWNEGTVDSDRFPFNFETFAQGFEDDPDNRYRSRSFGQALSLEYALWDGRWRQDWELTHQQYKRVEYNGPLPVGDFPYENRYEGKLYRAEWRNHFQMGANAKLLVGLDHEHEDSKDLDSDAKSSGLFGQGFLTRGPLDFVLGARYQDHERFGDHATYQSSLVWRIHQKGSLLRMAYGSAFKSPALDQRYNPYYGNTNLKPEESKSYELGFDQPLGKRAQMRASYYSATYADLVDFLYFPETQAYAYGNQPEARMEGLESSLHWNFEGWGLGLNYDRLFRAETRATPDQPWTDLIRRAKEKATLNLHGHLGAQISWDLNWLYYGESQDHDFFTNAFYQKLDAYQLLDLACAYQLREGIVLELKAENLGDENYTQVIGYQVAGRSASIGIRIN